MDQAIRNVLTASGRLSVVLILHQFVGLSAARAELTVGLRFPDGSLAKTLTPGDVGSIADFEVWATITNTGGINGTGTHEGLKFVHYSVISERLLPGPLGSIDGAVVGRQLVNPFTSGAQQGTIQHLNSDGILDCGSVHTSSDSDVIRARSAATTWDDTIGTIGQPVPNGWEFLLQRIQFRIDSVPVVAVPGNGTSLSILVPSWADGALPGAMWRQDSDQSEINPDGVNTGTFTSGTSVTFRVVPEPSGAVLLAAGMLLTSYALCRGRRKSEPRMRGSSPG